MIDSHDLNLLSVILLYTHPGDGGDAPYLEMNPFFLCLCLSPSIPPPLLSLSMWGRQRENVDIVLHASATFLRKSLPLSQGFFFLPGLEFVKQAKVVSQEAMGIFLVLPHQSWDCKHMLSLPGFLSLPSFFLFFLFLIFFFSSSSSFFYVGFRDLTVLTKYHVTKLPL